MRAILAGITGVNKRRVLKNLEDMMAENGMVGISDPRHMYDVCIEDRISEQSGGDYGPLLTTFRPVYQLQLWKEAARSIVKELDQFASDNAVLPMHLTHYAQGRLFSLVDFSSIRRFEPDAIVTLVDDVLDIWGAITLRNQQRGTNFKLRLREVFSWRSVEVSFADFLARSLYEDRHIPHYVVAVKHPTETLFRLLFRSHDYVKIYSAFPITSTRESPETRLHIDETRALLHERFIVFDPLTIDEDVPEVSAKAEEASAQAQSLVTIEESESRWPLPIEGTLAEGRPSPYPITIEPGQILEIREDVKQQVRTRDYTLIDQAQCVAGYRPNYQKRLSQGMVQEFQYAINTANPPRRVIVCSPPEDGETGHPFLINLFQDKYSTRDDWIEALSKVATPAP